MAGVKIVTFQEKEITPSFSDILSDTKKFQGNGVKVASVTEDYETDFTMEYDPSHPDADENGYVSLSKCQYGNRDDQSDRQQPRL